MRGPANIFLNDWLKARQLVQFVDEENQMYENTSEFKKLLTGRGNLIRGNLITKSNS